MSSQRVEGYSFLILFREVDSLQPPAELDRGVHPLKECSRERLRKEEVKKKTKGKIHPFLTLSIYYIIPARSSRTPAFLIPELKISLHVRDVCAPAALSKSCYPMPSQSAISTQPERN